MEKEAVANSSSLIFLAKGNIFHLAKNVFSKIFVPSEVIEEIFNKDSPENNIIRKELNSFLIESKLKNIKEFPLHLGEKSAISLCIEKNIKLFLSDDRKARIYAKSLGIEIIGITGILLHNLERVKIKKEEFIALLDNLIKKGYYISPQFYEEIIKLIKNN